MFMTFNSVRCFAVEDEESTIEEQEATEVPADQKAELAELTKEGAFCAFFSGHCFSVVVLVIVTPKVHLQL